MYQRYSNILARLEQENNLRILPERIPSDYVNLSSNDYLGINDDVALRFEFYTNVIERDLRFGASSSRLLTGNSNEYISLENIIATTYQREACLVYNSGYHANIGILPGLATKNDLIIADKLVHASIIDGLLLSKAEVLRYNHLDYEHLDRLLQKHRDDYNHVFIVTESIFSMDGDIADLTQLVKLKKQHNCFIYVDEAHAIGVRGNQGLGIAEEQNVIEDCDFIVGTFGKAIASMGAYVVCNNIIKRYLINHSRSLIFTTALPPVNVAWTTFIFKRLPFLEEKRIRLMYMAQDFSNTVGIPSQSHIIPFITGSNENAINLSAKLKKNGILALPIRYPTVPKNKARLRFSLNATLKTSDLQKVYQIIKQDEPALD